MKRKQAKALEPVVPQEILEQARKAAIGDRIMRPANCRVCGSEVAPFSVDELCWVCRRLKISAWADSENQQAMQE